MNLGLKSVLRTSGLTIKCTRAFSQRFKFFQIAFFLNGQGGQQQFFEMLAILENAVILFLRRRFQQNRMQSANPDSLNTAAIPENSI